MSYIEKLFNNLDKLIDNYVDTEETKKARKDMEESLGRELYFEHEEEIATLLVANEKQGFMYGFQYAVSLLTSGREILESCNS